MHKQSDNGKVTRMAMIEIPVRKKAAGPGPSGSAENALRYLPRCKYSSIMVAIVFPAKFPESGGNIFGIFSVLDLKLFLGMTKTSIHLLILDSGPKSLKSKNI